MPGRSVSSACLLRQVSHRRRVPDLAIAAQISSREIGSGTEQMPRVLEIGIQTVISRRGVSVIAHTMKTTRFWRDSGLSFERAAVGSWIAVGAAEEVVAT
jgi:hypothetical protein